jgi:hypothetical protein
MKVMSENVHNSLIKNYPDPCMVAFASNLKTQELTQEDGIFWPVFTTQK